ncbi:MAG: CHAP domain-containing protein [Bacteroidetes bacterium]|nr:CHAP domain-containing protein [Bacteroidota bacterium]
MFARVPLLILFLFFVASTNAQESNSIAKKILSFCDANKGKKVGKGECWDLAKEALNNAEATWTPPYAFGKELKKKDLILAGDIIQFEKVTIEYPDGAWKDLPHHTAIIYKVVEGQKLIVAEQNANGKRFVIFSEIDLSYVKKGKFTIYRPQ